jgi:hypothetical protein
MRYTNFIHADIDPFEFSPDGDVDFGMHALKARAYIQHERLLAEESDE